MIEAPEIITTTAQLTAVIHFQIPKDKIREVMGPGLTELMGAVSDQGVAVIGPWFTRHLTLSPDQWDFEISLPVAEPVQPMGRVQPGHLPAQRVARTVYHGVYEELGSGWQSFTDWIEANGHTPAADLWEAYLVGPEISSDPGDWRTQLNRPLLPN